MTVRRVRHYLYFSIVLTSILILIHLNSHLITTNKDIPVNITRIPNSRRTSNQPTILIWDKYFGGEWPQVNIPCNCYLTTDRSLFNTSSAVVFHLRDFNIRDVPEFHLQNQKFVMYNLESPCYTKKKKRDFELFQENIDWSMTYRSDSDIYTPYAEKKNKNTSVDDEAVNQYMISNLFKSKTRKVAWFVSNCDACSNREGFVSALKEHIAVDVYGSCGHLKCSDRSFCYEKLETDYKFYLSFENSIFVLGPSHDYKQILPDNSYVDALNFSSPRALADFLVNASDDELLYSSFFEWKNSYSFESMTHGSHFCKLCSKIREKEIDNHKSFTKKRKNLVDWWYTDSNCTSWNEKLKH